MNLEELKKAVEEIFKKEFGEYSPDEILNDPDKRKKILEFIIEEVGES